MSLSLTTANVELLFVLHQETASLKFPVTTGIVKWSSPILPSKSEDADSMTRRKTEEKEIYVIKVIYG